MYKTLSSYCESASDKSKWLEALADAQRLHDADKTGNKRDWLVVMGTIRKAIERGEPWPC